MTVTSSVTHYWFCPIYKPSTQPTFNLEQNETQRKQKSSAT